MDTIKCPHGESGWCDQCAISSARRNELNRELNLASNMTTRQAFAMAAMQGMMANPYIMKVMDSGEANDDSLHVVREKAYRLADIMTEEES